jgi:hypothetical protein
MRIFSSFFSAYNPSFNYQFITGVCLNDKRIVTKAKSYQKQFNNMIHY